MEVPGPLTGFNLPAGVISPLSGCAETAGVTYVADGMRTESNGCESMALRDPDTPLNEATHVGTGRNDFAYRLPGVWQWRLSGRARTILMARCP